MLNVAGVFYTTNNRFDSIYLPPNDRRTYVAWSEIQSADFVKEFWTEHLGLVQSRRAGGRGRLPDGIRPLEFDPKAPPTKTEAFWQIVGAGAAPENSELADILDTLGAEERDVEWVQANPGRPWVKAPEEKPCGPRAVTLDAIKRKAEGALSEWLNDRKNRRVMSHRMSECNYVPVQNPTAADGLWAISGKRQVIYARSDLPPVERFAAAEALVKAG